MVKKSVPDWLNSSLWSSPTTTPPPTDDDDDASPRRRAGKSTSSDVAAAPSKSATTAPERQWVTVAPARPEPPPEVEIRDPLSSSSGNENSVENGVRDPTGDDVSVQAQLLQEVKKKVYVLLVEF